MMDLCGFEGSPCLLRHPKKSKTDAARHVFFCGAGGGGCFSFGGTVQYIEESNIYLCFVV